MTMGFGGASVTFARDPLRPEPAQDRLGLPRELAAPSAASIDGLIALLPPMRAESLARAYDLQRLSGRQLGLLDWLLGVAAGAERVDSKLKPRNRSELEAEYLGFALGKLARSGCVPRWAPSGSGRLPTANEKIEISSQLDGLLWSVGIDGQELWPARAPKRAAPSQETLPASSPAPSRRHLRRGGGDPDRRPRLRRRLCEKILRRQSTRGLVKSERR